MAALWAVPAVLFLLAAVPLAVLLRRAGQEAAGLAAEMRLVGELGLASDLRPAMVEVRDGMVAARQRAARLVTR